jgi:hypothetical protein
MDRTAACVQAGGREGIHGTWRHLNRLRRGAGVRAHVDHGVDPAHATQPILVESVKNLWYRWQAVRQRDAKDPRANTLAFKRRRLLSFRDIFATRPKEEPCERVDDAIRVPFANENRVPAVQVLHVVDFLVLPALGVGKRRRTIKGVQDQFDLRPHTRIHRHFCLLWSGGCLDGL